jgi:4-hydroxy-tetrahydrodipicolinate synthase
MLTGSVVAIATPMQPGGELDLPALAKLIDFHVANGTSGIVIVGTTGESPTVGFRRASPAHQDRVRASRAAASR